MNKPRTLEVTVLSAEGLRVDGKPAKDNVFVAVYADATASHTTAMSGAGSGGGFHVWNEKFSVDFGMRDVRSIAFDVNCRTRSGSVKDVGAARIAVSDFLGGLVPDTFLQFLSYRLKDRNGQRNGIINFSVRVVAPDGGKVGDGGDSCRFPAEKIGSSSSSGLPAGYDKIGGGSCGLPATGNCGGSGVVTGIPIWGNYDGKNV